MKVLHFTGKGKVTTRDIINRKLSQHFDMHVRDLRPVLLLRQLFTVSVRGEGIIVNLGMLKMIIGKDQAFVLTTGNEKATKIFSDQILEKISQTRANSEIPFEFLFLEEAFSVVLTKTYAHYNAFASRLEQLLQVLTDTPTQGNFEKLLVLKKEISRMEKTVQELQNAVEEVLDDDEEMNDIILSANKMPDFEEDDAESVLENILEQVMEIANKIAEKKENIDDTQEIVTLQMASIRNTIIQFDLIASVGTSILALGTLITGFYGMNLLNHTEANPQTFFIVVGFVVFFSFFSIFALWKYMKRKNILSF